MNHSEASHQKDDEPEADDEHDDDDDEVGFSGCWEVWGLLMKAGKMYHVVGP